MSRADAREERRPGTLYESDVRRRRLVGWCVLPQLTLFVLCLALINFTSLLDGAVAGALSWAYVVAIGQFVIAIASGHLYIRLAERLDRVQLGEGHDLR